LGFDDTVGTWVHTRLGSTWIPGRGNAIGLLNEKGNLCAGWTYSDWNRAHCVVDVVAEAEGWCTPEFLFMCFDYPFNQLGCKRITSPVAAINTHCQKFVEWLGATREATLKDACPTGDVHIYRMFKQECRWLTPPVELPRIRQNHG
jgi:RimJ/RimL family protein N-acetyltransferase